MFPILRTYIFSIYQLGLVVCLTLFSLDDEATKLSYLLTYTRLHTLGE
jgi:hypothetical protein